VVDLLRRAWDTLDAFKQAYPENWHDDDQQVMDDLLKADLDLSGVKREWINLTYLEIDQIYCDSHDDDGRPLSIKKYERALEAKLREKNTC
jgi:hypothetical protein